jgi:hypothetical protein
LYDDSPAERLLDNSDTVIDITSMPAGRSADSRPPQFSKRLRFATDFDRLESLMMMHPHLMPRLGLPYPMLWMEIRDVARNCGPYPLIVDIVRGADAASGRSGFRDTALAASLE